MPEIRIDVPGEFGLSEEQQAKLREQLQSTVVETLRGTQAEVAARAIVQSEEHEKTETVHHQSSSKVKAQVG